ncbi:TIGR01906 family membrane protein [Alkalithermobacter paradoxus]|uniref:Integral membrane protein n=1 Tax=Alkalithermobacter paradoxus TaxID=29349 RepID=A0A1V4IC73_9FIRM|nr:hypothetical protein CLOTH_04980 [[Clostridium] thermoalcaliphilum]
MRNIKYVSTVINTIASIILSLIIIIMSVKLTLAFKPLYYFDIDYLNIEEDSGMTKEEIKVNYDYTINYLMGRENEEFNLPTLPSSKYGKIHFKEVRDIFKTLDVVLIVTSIAAGLIIYISTKNNQYIYILYAARILFTAPLILMSAFILDFDTSFTVFHEIFFDNTYWQFDPNTDPIINMLPQEFFYHSALLILTIILLFSFVLKLLYIKVTKVIKSLS